MPRRNNNRNYEDQKADLEDYRVNLEGGEHRNSNGAQGYLHLD